MEKSDVCIRNQRQNPNRIVFSVMGEERIELFSFTENQKVRIRVEIDSREWQGFWFTEIRCVASLAPDTDEKSWDYSIS